jgi:hypothetical protein
MEPFAANERVGWNWRLVEPASFVVVPNVQRVAKAEDT